jgi:lipid-A-disaccharide synthase-like uncharacterized protein
MNGAANPGRPIAVLSLWIICSGFLIFWIDVAKLGNKRKTTLALWQWSGVLSMVLVACFFLRFHDEISIVAGAMGLIAIAGLVRLLSMTRFNKLFYAGLILIILIVINSTIYFSGLGIEVLPIVQKLTFLALFIWVIWINLLIVEKVTS